MEVIIRPDAQSAARLTAELLVRQVRTKPDSVLGLATGRTMERVYTELVRMYTSGDVDFSRCRTFNLDEYVGLPPDDPGSYCFYMNDKLFQHINIDPANTHFPNGLAADFQSECNRYEDIMRVCGGIDLQLLGIGKSGHIGFNEPLSALRSRTREKALTPTTIEQNAPLFPSPDEVPRRGVTMGVGTILDSRQCLLLATGREKANIIARALEGPVTSMISATALQLHPACRVIVDENAAAELTQKDYYRWIFENEPEWRTFQSV